MHAANVLSVGQVLDLLTTDFNTSSKSCNAKLLNKILKPVSTCSIGIAYTFCSKRAKLWGCLSKSPSIVVIYLALFEMSKGLMGCAFASIVMFLFCMLCTILICITLTTYSVPTLGK